MSVQQDTSNKKQCQMCKECNLFYGTEALEGLCSACHKKCKGHKKEEIMDKSPTETLTPASVSEVELSDKMEQLILEPTKKEQIDKKRCFGCNKKTGLLGIQCKCGYVFCNSHRLPENHCCDFDFKESGKEKLRKQVVKVYNGKIASI